MANSAITGQVSSLTGGPYVVATSGSVSIKPDEVEQVRVTTTTGATNLITLTGSNGGNPTISTTSGALALGNGQLAFPATQSASSDANTLDDYEEGTWTPAMAFNGTSVTTYTSQVGMYRKVGSVAFVQMYLNISDNGSGVGQMSIFSFPFATDSTAASYSNVHLSYSGFDSDPGSAVWGLLTPGSALTNVYYSAADGTALSDSIVGNDFDIYGTAVYAV